ncbi:MAG: hypothetical protein KIS66_01705 [Fimbriimonadaceae bacterium]|nr:hypothetical protein [Fimbriimonadaceae bacterium]
MRFKCDGTILAVEGTHAASIQGKEVTVHSAFGIVSWDPKGGYRIESHLANGLKGDFSLTVSDLSYTWEVLHPMLGKMHYAMRLVDGEWVETGEVKQADGTLKKVFEMRLKRQDVRAVAR